VVVEHYLSRCFLTDVHVDGSLLAGCRPVVSFALAGLQMLVSQLHPYSPRSVCFPLLTNEFLAFDTHNVENAAHMQNIADALPHTFDGVSDKLSSLFGQHAA